MGIDRTFIDKFDSFIFTIRRILYYGDTSKKIQPTDPKHDRWRFINFFGSESNNEYYNSKNDSFDFDNDDKLKDEFANLYSYKSLNITQMGDLLQIFSSLDDNEKTAEQISSTRALKNINRRLVDKEELVQSGSVIAHGNHKRTYTKNTDLLEGFTDKEKFITALDFATKKNNFSTFASTYKKLVCCRDGVENKSCDINIDHQLFHPILDEKHIWDVVSAITENRKIKTQYCIGNFENNELIESVELIPLKIMYDNLYGRTYLFTYDGEKFITMRFDRIFSIEQQDCYDEQERLKYLEQLEIRLKTAWLVSTNAETEHIIVEFKNTPAVKARVENEGRHGRITSLNESTFTYEIDVNDPIEMTNWILMHGSNCKVIEPKSLVEHIVGILEVMAE